MHEVIKALQTQFNENFELQPCECDDDEPEKCLACSIDAVHFEMIDLLHQKIAKLEHVIKKAQGSGLYSDLFNQCECGGFIDASEEMLGDEGHVCSCDLPQGLDEVDRWINSLSFGAPN